MDFLLHGYDDDEVLRNAIESSLEDYRAQPVIPLLPDDIDGGSLLDSPVASKALSLLRTVEENRRRLQDLLRMDIGSSEEDAAEAVPRAADVTGAEPESGVCIAVAVPEVGKRYQRKFNPSDFGRAVYAWAAAQDELLSSGLRVGDFDLLGATAALNPNATLSEQRIANRTLFKVVKRHMCT